MIKGHFVNCFVTAVLWSVLHLSYSIAKPLWDFITKYYWNRPPPLKIQAESASASHTHHEHLSGWPPTKVFIPHVGCEFFSKSNVIFMCFASSFKDFAQIFDKSKLQGACTPASPLVLINLCKPSEHLRYSQSLFRTTIFCTVIVKIGYWLARLLKQNQPRVQI